MSQEIITKINEIKEKIAKREELQLRLIELKKEKSSIQDPTENRVKSEEISLISKELYEYDEEIPDANLFNRLITSFDEIEDLDKEINTYFETSENKLKENKDEKHIIVVDQFGTRKNVIDGVVANLKAILDKRKFIYQELKRINFELNQKEVLDLAFPFTGNIELPYSFNELNDEEKSAILNTQLNEIIAKSYLPNSGKKIKKVVDGIVRNDFPHALNNKYNEYKKLLENLLNKKEPIKLTEEETTGFTPDESTNDFDNLVFTDATENVTE